MHNQSTSIYSSTSQTPSDIVKAIKGSIIAAPPPTYKGEKILRRTDTNITSKRNADDWKDHFHRREDHKSKGFFSLMTQPYVELGGAELDNKKLVLKALSDIGRTFECQKELSFKRFNRNQDDDCDMTDLEKRQGRDRNHRFYRYEVSGNGFEAVKEILDEGGKKITWIKAGKPLYQLLEDNVKESTEEKKKARNKRNSTCDDLDLESTNHMLKEATNPKLGSLANRAPDRRARSRFLGKLEAIKIILCSILNMKSKELKNRNPLAPELLKSLKKEVTVDVAQSIVAKQRLSTMPLSHTLTNRHNKWSGGTLAESRLSGPTSISAAGKEPFLTVSNEDLRSVGSRCRSNTGYASVRSSIGAHATSRPGKGTIFSSKGNSELPIWQKVLQEDARKEEAVRKPRNVKKKRQFGNVEKIPELAKKAFDKMKTKNSNKLLRELDTRMGYFRQRLHCLDVSIAEIAIKNMRSRVKDAQSRKTFDLSWLKSWYETLCEEQRHLLLENDQEVSDKVNGLKLFSRMALSTIPYLRAKLCLLVMSLPVYELCTLPMQEGLKFVLSSVLVSSESNLEDWMVSRKLITSNAMSD